MKSIHHILGDFDGLKQHCVLCGEAIIDYTNAMFAEGSGPPPGWPAGDLYMTGKNPTVMETTKPEGTEIIPCTQK